MPLSQALALNTMTSTGGAGAFSTDTVTHPGSGLVFINTYGAGVTTAFHTAIVAAETYLEGHITNAVTIHASFDLQLLNTAFSGQNSFNPVGVSYTTLVNAMASHATSADDIAAVNKLRSMADPSGGQFFAVPVGEARALGLNAPSTGTDDSVVLNSYYWNDTTINANPGDVEGVLMHELTEGAMGRIGGLWAPMDLFRYTASGQLDDTGGRDGQLTYFSPNGQNVNTGLRYHNPINASGQDDDFDWADWDQVGQDSNAHDPFGPGGPGAGDPGTLSTTDLRIMDVLGWTLTTSDTTTPTLVANNQLTVGLGTTTTISAASLAFSDPDNTDAQLTYTIGTGPADGTLLKSGTATASFTQADIDNGLISYRETAAGATLDSFSFVVADPSGNQTATQTFHIQMSVTVESFGTTSLAQVGNNYFLYAKGTTNGPELKYQNAPVTAGQFGVGWVPFGAEPMASGYEVAWKNASSGQFTAWNTDPNGNYVSSPIQIVTANDSGLEALEPGFQQDLNGDGKIGPPAVSATIIESFGATSLAQVGNNYFLYAKGTTTGPALKYQNAPVTAGQFGTGWVPFGAEPAASGYEVAWKNASSGQFTAWNTDANGNYVSSPIQIVTANDSGLEALEPGFQQDLNGDGKIGPPAVSATIIESFGATSLAQVGNNYFLYAKGTTTGPALKYQNAPVTAGQFGTGWVPFGAEPTASGYEVAWKNASSGQFTAWNTDANGNYVSSPIQIVTANDSGLEALEPSFQQDLNGDGSIGAQAVSAALIESVGATSLAQTGNNYFLYAHGTTTGPELRYQNAPVTAGQFGTGWVPFGAERTASGYEVAWKNASSGQFTAWNTDTNGNYVSSPIQIVTANDSGLEALEPSFQQDLNGDGTIGIPAGASIASGAGSPTDLIWPSDAATHPQALDRTGASGLAAGAIAGGGAANPSALVWGPDMAAAPGTPHGTVLLLAADTLVGSSGRIVPDLFEPKYGVLAQN